MSNDQQLYLIRKTFTGGWNVDTTYTGVTSVRFPAGFVCEKPVGGSPYRVDWCKPVSAEAAAIFKAARDMRRGG